MNFLKLPLVRLVAQAEVERLRRKLAVVKAEARTEAYWLGVQAMKQPRLVEDQPDYGEQMPFDDSHLFKSHK